MKKLTVTDASIRNLKPRPQIYDKSLGEGFNVRVSPDGTKTVRYVYQFQKKRRTLKLGEYPKNTLATLKKAHAAAVGIKASGRDPAQVRDDRKQEAIKEREAQEVNDRRMTVRKLIKLFEKGHRGVTDITMNNYLGDLNGRITDKWGDVYISDLKPSALSYWLDKIDGDATAASLHSSFSAMLTFATKRGEIEQNPLAGVERRQTKKRSRALDYLEGAKKINRNYPELKQFWNGVDKAIFPSAAGILKFALLTGKRQTELRKLEWEHIRGNVWEVRDENAKSGKVSDLPVLPMMRTILDSLPKTSKYVFPQKNGKGEMSTATPTNQLRQAFKAEGNPLYGMRGFTMHDLRRTLSIHMYDSGYDVSDVKVLLDHSQKSEMGATQHYLPDVDDLTLKKRTRLLEAWHRKLAEIVGEPVQNNVLKIA